MTTDHDRTTAPNPTHDPRAWHLLIAGESIATLSRDLPWTAATTLARKIARGKGFAIERRYGYQVIWHRGAPICRMIDRGPRGGVARYYSPGGEWTIWTPSASEAARGDYQSRVIQA
jgi:hypothetical protein